MPDERSFYFICGINRGEGKARLMGREGRKKRTRGGKRTVRGRVAPVVTFTCQARVTKAKLNQTLHVFSH